LRISAAIAGRRFERPAIPSERGALTVFGPGAQARSGTLSNGSAPAPTRRFLWCMAAPASGGSKKKLAFGHLHRAAADAGRRDRAASDIDFQPDARWPAHLDPLLDPVAVLAIHRRVMAEDSAGEGRCRRSCRWIFGDTI